MASAQTLLPTDGRESGPARALPSATTRPQRTIGAEVRARPEQRGADPRCEDAACSSMHTDIGNAARRCRSVESEPSAVVCLTTLPERTRRR